MDEVEKKGAKEEEQERARGLISYRYFHPLYGEQKNTIENLSQHFLGNAEKSSEKKSSGEK